MAVDFDKTIMLVNSMPDNILILFILKSIELGTLKFDSVTTILGTNGISLQINRELPVDTNNTNNYNNVNSINDNGSGLNDIIDNSSTQTASHSIEFPSIDNCNESNINSNNTYNFKFGEFSSRGNQIWNANYATEKEKYLNGATDELKKKYKDFLGNNQLKSLPKEISNFRRAKEHFQNIFIPELVCRCYFFPFSLYHLSLLIYSQLLLSFRSDTDLLDCSSLWFI
jgi:hypothetical protein